MSRDHPAEQLGESATLQGSTLELLWACLQKLFEPDLPSVHDFFSISATCRCLDEFELPVTAAAVTAASVETAAMEITSVETSAQARLPARGVPPWPPLSSVDAARSLLYPINCI